LSANQYNHGTTSLTINGEPYCPTYTPAQLEVFFGIPDDIYYVVLPKGRRVGFTHGAAKYCIERMIEGAKILWVDVRQSNLEAYHTLFFEPELKKFNSQFWTHNKSEHFTTLLNGTMKFVSAEKPEGAEGFQYTDIICNEAGIIFKGMKGRYLWKNALLPMTLQTQKGIKPRVLFIGTPKGKRSKKDEKHLSATAMFYELAQRGESKSEKDKRWTTKRFSTYDNPLLEREDIEELKAEVPPETRAQELHGEFVDINNEAIFKRSWFPILENLPDAQHWQRLIISADTAFKAKEANDNSALGLVLEFTLGYLIIDVVKKKLEFPELCVEAKDFYNKHNGAYYGKTINYLGVEDKASGQSLVQTLQRETKIPLKTFEVKGDKVERANNITETCKSGRVYLLKGAWNDDFLDEICDFNAAMDTPDDQVDMLTHAIGQLQKSVKGKPAAGKVDRRSKSLVRSGYYGNA
jgi:predicted phage terminase large subunit-like protein